MAKLMWQRKGKLFFAYSTCTMYTVPVQCMLCTHSNETQTLPLREKTEKMSEKKSKREREREKKNMGTRESY